MSEQIKLKDVIALLRSEMVHADTLYVARLIVVYLNALHAADPEGVKKLLFTPIPINQQLAYELGLGQRVAESGECTATGYDLLMFMCGFILIPNYGPAGALIAVYNQEGATADTFEQILGFTTYADIPAALTENNTEMAPFCQKLPTDNLD